MEPNDPAKSAEPSSPATQLEVAATAPGRGAIRDLLAFMGENKKWWLLPIVIVLVLIGALLLLAGTGAAPFLYPLF
jgi:hypothetical protein